MTDIYRRGLKNFLDQARRELEKTGFLPEEIEKFATAFTRTGEEEGESVKRLPIENLEDFIQNILRFTLDELDDPALAERMHFLRSLQVEGDNEIKNGEKGLEFRKLH